MSNITTRSQIINTLEFVPSKYKGKQVVIRACLNVSYDKAGAISEITRVDEALKALHSLKEVAARIVILAHLGRPEGKASPEFSLEKVRQYLSTKLETEISLVTNLDNFDPQPQQQFYLVENIRFWPEEESKDENIRQQFASKLAKLGEVFINDAFPDYRIAASTYELAKVLPASLGPSFIKEVQELDKLNNPDRPYVAILGGAKLSEKVELIGKLGEIADKILVGGALAYTLLKAQGQEIGKSLLEDEKLVVAKEILAKYQTKLVLPVDHVVLPEFKQPESEASYEITANGQVPADKVAVDIGPETETLFSEEIKHAKTILWNGPMGVFEWDGASHGTRGVMMAVAKAKNAYRVTGGGDSLAAIAKFGIDRFEHISTGGGAMLSFLADEKFPTLDIILEQQTASKSAIIVYGTGSGNTELVAEAIASGLIKHNFTVKTIKGELANVAELSQYDLVVLGCATWNVGKLQDYFAPFYSEFVKLQLTSKPMAIFALGDSKNYDIFCGAADWLEEAVAKVGGRQIMPTLRIDGPPHANLQDYAAWGETLAENYFNQL